MEVIHMIYSMTGYGRDIIHINTTIITIEMRSVNHRYLDISIKAPHSLLFFEDHIKKVIQKKFNRGRIEVYINIEGDQFVRKSLNTDWKLLDEYMKTIEQMKQKYNISGDIPITMIPTLPEIITVQELDDDSDELIEPLIIGVKRACKQVLHARKKEANDLIKDIHQRMAMIEKTVSFIHDMTDEVINAYQKRITERIHEFLNEEIIDKQRLHQEIAFLIEKGDITEEITRLFSHIDHLNKLLETGGTVGRVLDFIVQEMHREINTIGSKAIDAKTSEKVIFLKSEVEKIREQIQNIE